MATRLAVGVLAAKAPKLLEQTLSNWHPDLCRVYVHVDAKFDVAEYGFVERFPNVRLVEPRSEVFWGGFSMVEAELALLRAASADGFDLLVLHSDDALPLMSADRMLRTLDQEERWSPSGPVRADDILARYGNFYCLDAAVSHPLIHKWNFEPSDLPKLAELIALQRIGKYPLEDLFWTSQWKCLTRGDVDDVLRLHRRGGHLSDSFRFSMIPDEHYVPTLLGRRPGGFRVVDRFLWTDFTRHPRPYVFQDVEELRPARDAGFLFIRKVHDPAVAAAVIAENASSP